MSEEKNYLQTDTTLAEKYKNEANDYFKRKSNPDLISCSAI